jgi:hypothetical protein
LKRKNGECAACSKYSVLIVVEKIYIKCNIWRVVVGPSYIWDAGFLKVNKERISHMVQHTPAGMRYKNQHLDFELFWQ